MSFKKSPGLSGINILSVYPNPASDKVYVTFESVTDLSAFRINLTDVAGRNHAATLVETKTTGDLKQVVLDVSGLSGGLYMLFIKDDQYSTSSKIVVNNY
ncbi:MAG: T9SS type A sorting domain-containing protein [Bacteroidetes bacterium]|nr:T9SS type A sorting domain-containing protein [Bacteroidota bacterium]